MGAGILSENYSEPFTAYGCIYRKSRLQLETLSQSTEDM